MENGAELFLVIFERKISGLKRLVSRARILLSLTTDLIQI